MPELVGKGKEQFSRFIANSSSSIVVGKVDGERVVVIRGAVLAVKG